MGEDNFCRRSSTSKLYFKGISCNLAKAILPFFRKTCLAVLGQLSILYETEVLLIAASLCLIFKSFYPFAEICCINQDIFSCLTMMLKGNVNQSAIKTEKLWQKMERCCSDKKSWLQIDS